MISRPPNKVTVQRQPYQTHVVAAGVFDGLHDGHRYYLRAAKRLGDVLTVIVARGQTVQVIKNKTPRYSEKQRRAAVARFPDVDYAVLGNRLSAARPEHRFALLLQLKPDVICLGYDQPVKTPALRRFLNTHGLRTTRIVRARKAPIDKKP
ncbi:MAG: FAD synthetase [Parcubacteria group bacterium Gr01-1014_106]|nr:MAG: FAD synthetase [Parcubacteria group bacterium Gr01-1014_106]